VEKQVYVRTCPAGVVAVVKKGEKSEFLQAITPFCLECYAQVYREQTLEPCFVEFLLTPILDGIDQDKLTMQFCSFFESYLEPDGWSLNR
jgi:hypothetical protein